MSDLIAYQFKNSNIRIELKNNEPLFCLTDVANALNIKNAHSNRFNFSEKGIHKMYTQTKGGKQELIFIDEANLYRVIFRSNKKEAIDFQNWVFEEVLPSIRKTGGYMADVTLTRHQRTQIKRAVVLFIGQTGRTAQEVYKLLYARFGVQSYQDIPARHFDEAMSIIDKETQKGRPCILLDKTCNNNFLLHVENGAMTVFVPSLNSYVVTKI
nr:BRO family protein [Snodgrassella alvi]